MSCNRGPLRSPSSPGLESLDGIFRLIIGTDRRPTQSNGGPLSENYELALKLALNRFSGAESRELKLSMISLERNL
jgi:hypothetical protein